MKLILTSFGITGKPNSTEYSPSLFYQMPPIDMRASYEAFTPDYASLLLCDKLIMDESSYNALQENPHKLYKTTAESIRTLYSEGFVELIDFGDILKRNFPLLDTMINNDLSMLDYWVDAFTESVRIWDSFTEKAKSLYLDYPKIPSFMKVNKNGQIALHDEMHTLLQEYMGHEIVMSKILMHGPPLSPFDDMFALQVFQAQTVREALASSKKRKKSEFRSILQESLRGFLSYINANIVISNELEAAFHDWADMMPFYKNKFIMVGKNEPELEANSSAAHMLFDLAFPEFNITNDKTLLKLLSDKRINDLRQLVQDAADGKVEFDQEFAKTTLKEVLKAEQETSRYRNIISYLTLPLDFLPWIGTVAEKVVDEGLGMLVEKKLKSKYRWFYLLSEATETRK